MTEPHWFDAFTVYDEVISADCPECGSNIEEGYFCSECGEPTPESESAFDEDGVYCAACKRECIFCGAVCDRADMTMSDDGVHEWCPECESENSQAA